MTGLLRTTWAEYIAPMFQRPRRLQVAALCYRGAGDQKEVLLITSRGTGRWIIPKGWLMRGLDAREAAMREAWEEAGVASGSGDATPIGTYSYHKQLDDGLALPIETLVFPVAVEAMKDDFPEAHERRRKWVSASDAANLVDEPGLKSILRNLH
jgi:8-oxo-dGTP pyrophosphatase MutT (NUDIX family)